MNPNETPKTTAAWHATLDWCNKRDIGHDPQHAALANLAEDLERLMNSAINDRQVQYGILQRVRHDRDEFREDARRLRQQAHDLERMVRQLRAEIARLTSATNPQQ